MSNKEKEEKKQSTPPPMPEPQPQNEQSFEDMASQAAGAGLENVVEGRDTSIPFLQIIQTGSPQLKRENTKYIKGAKAGDIVNTVTNKIYDTSEPDGKPLLVVPVGFVHIWVEWKLRHLGGGFVRNHKDEMILAKTVKGGPKMKDDVLQDNPQHHIVSTAMHSVIVLDEETGRYPAVISMTSTQLKKSRNWLSRQGAIKLKDGKQAPAFYKLYAIRTGVEKHAEGEAYGWIIETKETVNPQIFTDALSFYKKLQTTTALPAPPDATQPEEDDEKSPY